MSEVISEPFFSMPDGREAKLYTITNGKIVASITDFGGTLTNLIVPDRDGNCRDVVLGHDKPSDYLENRACFGALIGRYANRIRAGRFTLNGTEYQIVRNEKGRTALHGGNGLHLRLWDVPASGRDFVTFAIESPDGDAGFPGNLKLEVTYRLTKDDELRLDYKASCDADTPVNFTEHSYFNLTGGGTVEKQQIMIDGGFLCEVNKSLIPTGWLNRVNDTPFDLRKMTEFGKVFAKLPKGIDHNYVLNDRCADCKHAAATAYSPASGIKLECFTTEPGLQLYTAGALNRRVSMKNGKKGFHFAGFCLETQHYPDSPNHPEFPSTILKKGEKFSSTTVYRFSVK